ncbi:hypothetical protein BC829DRAFT_388932 [Chytridium lagenaria]|nr:hypothetical protein BC829DRAFT_388932 [Chytridium lagenaria]
MDDLHRPRIRFTATDAYPSPPSSPPLMPTVPPPSPVITKDLWRTPSVTTSGDERRVRWRSDEEGRLPLVVGATRVRRCVSVSIGATGVRDGAEVVGRQRKDGEEVLVRHATAPPRIVTPKKRNVPSEKKRDIVGDVLLSRDKEEEEEMIREEMRWWCGMAVVVSMGVMVWNMGVYVVMLLPW